MSAVPNRLGIEFITVLGMPPVEFVHFAADLGCASVGMALAPFTANPWGYPGWSLRDDAALRKRVGTVLRERNVAISLGEGFLVREGSDACDAAHDLDLMSELGVKRVNILTIDTDLPRSVDQLGVFADLAAARGMEATLEYMAGMTVGTMGSAVSTIRSVGRDNLKLLVDCMHLSRGGEGAADLAACDPGMIGYLQLCDVRVKPVDAGYGEEARHNRLPPGEGELALADIIAAVPRDVPVGLEVPQLVRAEAGGIARDLVGRAVASARAMLGGGQH